MSHSAYTIRLIAASLVAILMVGGSYALSGPVPFFGDIRTANAGSSEELLRAYAAKDTDSDGLFDWQEALYNTDPYDAESFKAGIKDGDAVAQGLIQPKVEIAPTPESTDPASVPGISAAPNSITDKFTQVLFKQYMLSRGEAPPTTDEVVSFVQAGVQNLIETSASPDTFDRSEVRISGLSGTTAVTAYAAALEKAFADNTVEANKSELFYFDEAIKGNEASLQKLEQVSGAYEDIANALMKMPVPAEVAQSHLSIANALIHMGEISEDMSTMNEDPLRALMGIGLYEEYANTLADAFSNLHGVFVAQSVVILLDQPGYEVYQTSVDADAIHDARVAQ